MKKIILIIILIISAQSIYSQTLLVENFNYSARDQLTNVASWNLSGSGKLPVVGSGIEYPGYLGSGIGNMIHLTNPSPGSASVGRFEMQNSGTVYLSFIMKVDSLSAASTAGYFICLDESGGPTNHNTTFHIKKLTSSTFNLGIRKYMGTTKYSPSIFTTNTTYLIVCSYTFIPGGANDIAKLYVFNSGVPATEPVTQTATDSELGDINDIGDIVVNNSFLYPSIVGTSVKLDGIRVGKSWNSTLFQNRPVNLDFKGFIQGFYNYFQSKMISDTVTVILRDTTAPYNIADSAKVFVDSLGKGLFSFNTITINVPYYLVVKHRNTIETWSANPMNFYNYTMNYSFTTAASKAMGGNMIFMNGPYCFYNGDVNQSGNINLADITTVYNAITSFTTGYENTDVTGDNAVNLADLTLIYNNASNFINSIKP